MGNIVNQWTNSFDIFPLNNFHNKNNSETVISYCNTYLSNNFPLDIFFKGNKYKKTQNNCIIYSSSLVKSHNADDLSKKLSNSNLLDFINS